LEGEGWRRERDGGDGKGREKRGMGKGGVVKF